MRQSPKAGDAEHGSGYRVIRGGSFFISAGLCRSADRSSDHPAYRVSTLGFRPAYPTP